METYSAKTWTEIAAASLIAALAAWTLYHSFHKPAPVVSSNSMGEVPPAVEAATASSSPLTIKSSDIPNTSNTSPSTASAGGCGGDCGGCGGCGAGSTSSPVLSQIVKQTNAVIAQMNAMANNTTAALVAVGNQNPYFDFISYESEPTA